MTWPGSLVVTVLTGIVGMLVSGFVANLAAGWYRMSSFEGASGYFVVAMALLGLVAGGGIGLAAARIVAAGPEPGFLKALGGALGTVLVIGGTVGGAARLLADVPPLIEGQPLLLAVEVAWPSSDRVGPDPGGGDGFVRLSSATGGRVVRASVTGPLFLDLARHQEGRWVAPGAVPIFTERGTRIISVGIGDQDLAGLVIDLRARPGQADREWTGWLPRAPDGAPALPDGFRYRYRVSLVSEPVRTDTVGPFEVATIAGAFHRVPETGQLAAVSRFQIRHRGVTLDDLENAGGVAVLGSGDTAALLVQRDVDNDGLCYLLRDRDGAVSIEPVAPCASMIEGQLLTTPDTTLPAGGAVRGWMDRTTFRAPGLYLMRHAVLDTRTLSFRPFTEPESPNRINGLPAAALSPDGRSFVWFSHDGSEDNPVLGVTDWQTDSSYAVAIDRDRMRYRDYHEIGPDWVAHHFVWVRDRAGVDRLQARKDFVPLPHRGTLELGKPGEYTSYTLRPAGRALRRALMDLLAGQPGAERLPDELDGHFVVVRLDGKLIKASTGSASGGYLAIGMEYGAGDPEFMARVAALLDSALATGRYDALFKPDE